MSAQKLGKTCLFGLIKPHKQNYEHIFIFRFPDPYEMIRWLQQAPSFSFQVISLWVCELLCEFTSTSSFATWGELSSVSDLLFAHLQKW